MCFSKKKKTRKVSSAHLIQKSSVVPILSQIRVPPPALGTGRERSVGGAGGGRGRHSASHSAARGRRPSCRPCLASERPGGASARARSRMVGETSEFGLFFVGLSFYIVRNRFRVHSANR